MNIQRTRASEQLSTTNSVEKRDLAIAQKERPKPQNIALNKKDAQAMKQAGQERKSTIDAAAQSRHQELLQKLQDLIKKAQDQTAAGQTGDAGLELQIQLTTKQLQEAQEQASAAAKAAYDKQ